MNPQLGQAWFRVAVFITLLSAILVVIEPRDGAEFVISVASLVIGLVFVALIVILTRRTN
jgi:hypothetical protein